MGTQILPLARDCLHITNFLRDNIEPREDPWRLIYYPCSANLKDGTVLPCLRAYSLREVAAFRRKLCMEQGLASRIESPSFWVSSGNNVAVSNIQSVSKSRFALSREIQSEFCAFEEIRMGASWCKARMTDGKELQLSCGGLISPFFDFPEPYSGDDVVSLHRTEYSPMSVVPRLFFDVYVSWPEEEIE